MALKQSGMIKRITASGGGDLEAKAGESLRVKWIGCMPSTNDTYVKVTIDRVTVAYYRVKGKAGNHLGMYHGAYVPFNLMRYLGMKGINVTIPVAEGQTLSVVRYAEAGNVVVVYDRYDAGDCKETDPNGTEAREYTFVQYANVGTAPTASGDCLIDTSLTPAEFPNFPCAAVVPAKHNIEMLGIVGSAIYAYVSTPGTWQSTFLKMLRNREVLFDVDRNGIPFKGLAGTTAGVVYQADGSIIGPATEVLVNTNIVTPGEPLMFDTPLLFTEGMELNVYLSVVYTGTLAWAANGDDEAFLLRVKRQ
jgi:hypothetical protein